MNSCFCILTHIVTVPLLERIERLNREIIDADFWVILDKPFFNCELLNYINVFYIDRCDLYASALANEFTEFPKNTDRLLMYFANTHDYDYYYFMENDVMYYGNYNEFILKYQFNESDVIIQNDANYIDGLKVDNDLYELFDITWGQPSIEIAFPNSIPEMRINNKIASDYPFKRIYQIMRFSKKFVNTYINLIKEGNINGHFEWAYTACLLEYNMTFSYFDEKMFIFFNEDKEDFFNMIRYENLNNCFVHHKYNLNTSTKIE